MDKPFVLPRMAPLAYALLRSILRLWRLRYRSRVYIECGREYLTTPGPVILAASQPVWTAWIMLAPEIQRSIVTFAGEEPFGTRLLGRYLEWSGHVRVSDEPAERAAALRTMRRRLQEGHTVGLFPEMPCPYNCGLDPRRLRAFQPGLAWLAASTHTKVVPIVIREHDRDDRRWLYTDVSIRIGPPINPPPGPNTAKSRAAFDAEVRQAMLALGALP